MEIIIDGANYNIICVMIDYTFLMTDLINYISNRVDLGNYHSIKDWIDNKPQKEDLIYLIDSLIDNLTFDMDYYQKSKEEKVEFYTNWSKTFNLSSRSISVEDLFFSSIMFNGVEGDHAFLFQWESEFNFDMSSIILLALNQVKGELISNKITPTFNNILIRIEEISEI